MWKAWMLAASVLLWGACNSETTTENNTEETTQQKGHDHEGHDHEGHDHAHGDAETTENGDGVHFGETIDPAGAISVDAAFAQVDKGEGLSEVMNSAEEPIQGLVTKVEGKVNAVCQVKGCWMELTREDGTPVRVRFKDYGFFVPLDLAGKEVVVEGNAYKTITSVEEARHYAEDAGKSKEEIAAITEPSENYEMYVTGVVIKQ